MKSAALPTSIGIVLACLPPCFAADAPDSHAAEFFEKSVRPVLADNCVSCHGAEKPRGGLRLDSKTALLKGADTGPVVVAGDPDKSSLIHAVRQDGDYKMPPPPRAQLPPEAVEALATWVKMGAPWPDGVTLAAPKMSVDEARKRHWSFQPVKRPAVPAVKNAAWVKNPIDAFILAKLEEKGLAPSKPADRRTLIRRVSFDLIGLPPTPEEVEAFVARPVAGRLRAAGGPAAGLAALRRTLGPPLARRRPLRRHQGLRLHGRAPLSVFLHLPRLRHPRLQRGPALRPVHRAAAGGGPAAARRRQAAAGRARLSDARPPFPQQRSRTSSTTAST